MKCTHLLASVALASVTAAQVSVEWSATHGVAPGVHNDFRAVAVDATGRVAVGGQTFAAPPVGYVGDFETCLYESDGTLAWSRSEDINDSDYCSSVAFDGTGGLLVAGGGSSGDLSTGTRTLLHYDAVGNLLWNNTRFGTPNTYNAANALALCPNGDVIVAGVRDSDLLLERIDPAGNILWSWFADGGNGGNDILSAVAVGPNGDVWATGTVDRYSDDLRDRVVVVRVTSAGVPVWIRKLNGAAHRPGYANALVVDAAGNTTVAGSVGRDAAIARWDPAGNLAWVRTYDGPAHLSDNAKRIELDPFGRIVAAGYLWNTVTDFFFAVWCIDTGGNLIWRRTWHATFTGFDPLGDFVVDAMGAVSLCALNPLTITSLDSTGAFRWSWGYAGTSHHARAAAISGNDVIVAGGNSWNGLILKLNRTALEFCFGDGSSTPCPCVNASAPEQHAGCANALGLGARLVDNGASSLAHDSLVLAGSQMPGGDALYFQGTGSISGGAGAPFGDGLRCAGGTLLRLGSSTNVAGASHFPDFGDPSVSVRGLVTTPGTRRSYQVWYRDTSAFCTPAKFNFSNGLLITWTL